ncbi:MAG: fatty acid desaturase [Rhodospirillaceae bacterium]|nr:fatty acid desaturase [Rhodospirillaceae bacterium]
MASVSIELARASRDRAAARPFVDWPTLAVAAGTYAAFGLLTWFYHALPWWLVLPLGGYVVCLHGSLQHEATHGHPFRRRWLNSLLIGPSLWLWLPYGEYRWAHLRHHRDEWLTHPAEDPESYYIAQARWRRMGWLHRALRRAMNTAAGRLLLWPAYVVIAVLVNAVRRILAGDRDHIRWWALHVPAAGVVVAWVVWVCGIPFWAYVLLFAWPGLSLTLLRSFAEHRAAEAVGHRTAIIEAGPVMSLLYLNNNLHAVHHADPASPWHRRWALYRKRRTAILAENGGYWFGGYGEILRRYLFTPREPVPHPFM